MRIILALDSILFQAFPSLSKAGKCGSKTLLPNQQDTALHMRGVCIQKKPNGISAIWFLLLIYIVQSNPNFIATYNKIRCNIRARVILTASPFRTPKHEKPDKVSAGKKINNSKSSDK